MAKMNEPKVIAFADFETSNSNDIKEETGCDVRIVGNEAHMFDAEGKDMGFPRVRVKCAGILVRFQDGSRNGGVFESIEEMLGKVLEWRVDRMYFHNLRFDDSFIGSLIQDGKLDLGNGWSVSTKSRLINDMGQVYSDVLVFTGPRDAKTHRRVRHVCNIWDSAKIWASKLESIGKDFGVSKFVTPENEALRTGCDLRMKAYCIRDCLVLMTAMEYYFEKCNELTYGSRPFGWMTAASTAYHLCMSWVEESKGVRLRKLMFPPCNSQNGFPEWLREGYKGATPLLDPEIRGRILNDVKVFDVNSMYPTQMKNAILPCGFPVRSDARTMDDLMALKEKGWLWIAKVKMRADVKEGHRATYMLKRKGIDDSTLCAHVNDWDCSYRDKESWQVIDSVTIDLLMRDYENIHIELLDYVVFQGQKGFLAGFIEYWYKIKQEAGKQKDKSLKAFAKLILNSLYGKFGANPEHRSSRYEYDDDRIRLVENSEVEEDRDPLYLPFAIFITAYARDMISRTCNAFGFEHVAYTDTDSVHVHGMDNEGCFDAIARAGYGIDKDDLGCYDYESRWAEAIYVRNKGYFHFGELDTASGEMLGGKEIKMAGANGFDEMNCTDDVFDRELMGIQSRGCRVKGGTLILEKETAIDTRIDACIKTRKRVRGKNMSESTEIIRNRENEIFERYLGEC